MSTTKYSEKGTPLSPEEHDANIQAIRDNEAKVNFLGANQYSAAKVYDTKALLPAVGELQVSYKVSNDATATNNGFWHWNGTIYVKDADGYISTSEITNEFRNETSNSIYNINNVISGYWGYGSVSILHYSSNNWIKYPVIDVKPGDIIYIKNYLLPISTSELGIITDLSGTLVSKILRGDVLDKTFTIPLNGFKLYLNLGAQTNIGLSPSSNVLNIDLQKSISFEAITKINNKVITAKYLSDEVLFEGEVVNEKSPATKKYVDDLNINNLITGYGSPEDGKGITNDKYLDLYTNRNWINNNGLWSFIENAGDEIFEYPTGFNYKPFEIIKQQNKVFVPKFRGLYNEYIKLKANSLTQYYVDSVNGANSNNGLSEITALKTIQYAVLTKGARNIILLPCVGLYNRDSDIGYLTDIATSEPLIIRAKKGTSVNMGTGSKGNTYTWSVNGSCYTTSRTNVSDVLDSNIIDADGNFTFLTKVSTLALCQSTVNSWFTDGTLLAVHNSNGSVPTSNIEVLLNVANYYTPSINVPYIYLEGINFYTNVQQGNIMIRNNVTTQFNTKAYVSNCKGINNNLGNSFSFDNIKEVFIENCKAYKPMLDGFNYHTTIVGYLPMNVVEYNCFSKNTGLDFPLQQSSNGSSSHEGISIIRLNSYYNLSRGGTVTDVSASKSLNLNIRAYDCIFSTSACFLANDTNTIMWLYNCVGKNRNSVVKSAISNSATIYYDYETKLPNTNVGNVLPII